MLEHGGQLIQAARRYNIPLKDWLDLSTGLNPLPWPVNSIPIDAWSRLPEEDDGLLQAASTYYGSQSLLPVAGSQAAIQALPQLRTQPSRIAILNPAYAEHAYAWQSAGFTVTPVSSADINQAVENHDVIILINPNNPTGECFSIKQCLHWQSQLQQRGGWLIVDEAFIDSTPEHSLVAYTHRQGLIVLRSLGKFFGLAGARVGFVFAQSTVLNPLTEWLGPWSISGPSRSIAKQALEDTHWQASTRKQLMLKSQRLHQLLSDHALTPNGGTSLFQWIKTPRSACIYEQLAQQGMLTRLFAEPASIRFGLPADEQHWLRLQQALAALTLIQHSTQQVQP